MKVLVAHVPAGSGHQRAAEAIHQALQQSHPEAEVALLDGMDGMDGSYRWSFGRGYPWIIHHAPLLWGASYFLTDHALLRGWAPRLHRLSNGWHGRELERILQERAPEVLIGTHFFPMEVAGRLKRLGRLRARLITVITDFRAHSVWVADGIDDYVVATEATRQELARRGIPIERIHPLGIPMDPSFAQREGRRAAATRLGLDPARFTLLIVSGGLGTGPMEEVVRACASVSGALQMIVVAGKNNLLFDRLEALRPTLRHPMRPFGFVNHMHTLMEAANLMITKPGGLSCSEAMAKELPMILVAAIPGQESRNARAMEELGTGLWVRRIRELPRRIEQLRADPRTLERMAVRGREAGRPLAAFEAARLAFR